jgi:hypothetical protein
MAAEQINERTLDSLCLLSSLVFSAYGGPEVSWPGWMPLAVKPQVQRDNQGTQSPEDRSNCWDVELFRALAGFVSALMA